MVAGGPDVSAGGMHQDTHADRDAYTAGRDQIIDKRRVEVAAVPPPGAVDLPGPVAGLPRRPVRVFEGRAETLAVLEQALAGRGGAVVTQAVYGLGGVERVKLSV